MRGRSGQTYFRLIDRSNLTDSQKEQARTELRQVIAEVEEGKIFGFRMKIRGIHSLPYGGKSGGRVNDLARKGFTIIKLQGGNINRDVIECAKATNVGIKHPAISPEVPVEHFVKLTTRENDLVLDPFMGSGTTAMVCKKLGRRYIGFDLCHDYVEHARKRVAGEVIDVQIPFRQGQLMAFVQKTLV